MDDLCHQNLNDYVMRKRTSPQVYREFLCELSKSTPVCCMLQAAGNQDTLHIVNAIATGSFDITIRCFNVLLVSPTYTLPHSHGIMYTTPLVLFGSVGVLTFVR